MSVYVPLPHTGEFIRLLELAPGDHDDDLVASFLVHNLQNAQPEYTATSYVCGNDSRADHHITISGTKLGIYRNADEVLRRFRSRTSMTYLWIDVCCIDQDVPVEKAREVNVMYKTYQHAKRTVVWLGQADEHASAAMEFAKSVDAAKYLAEFKPTVLYAGNESQYILSKSHILDVLRDHSEQKSLTNACAEFLMRPYFTRVWCQQEGSLSADPIVVCGAEQMPWNHVFALAWLFVPRYTMTWPDWFLAHYPDQRYALLEPNLMFIRSVQEYRLRQMMIDEKANSLRAFSLLNAMHDTARFHCYDPRDKIFAVRNIATDLLLDDWAPQPDYITPWEEVYTDFAVRMAGRANAELLDWSGVCQQGKSSGLPSWVVDWRTRPWTQYINHPEWCAGGRQFRAKAEVLPRKQRNQILKALQADHQPRASLRYSLQITVMMQDSIAFLSGVLENWKVFDDIVTLRENVLAVDQKSLAFINGLQYATYMTSEPVLDAYNATLIANTTDQDALGSASYISHGAQDWRNWLSCGADLKNKSMPAYHDAIDSMDTFQYKHFCVSSAGYFCLVPDITRATDCVAIVKGIDMPIVLRAVGDQYVHLGQCYVHGMMELKAGELIEEFRAKFDSKLRQVVVHRPDGEVRRNGRKMDAGEYVKVLETLGERKVQLI